MQCSGVSAVARVRSAVATVALATAVSLSAAAPAAAAGSLLAGRWDFDEGDGQLVRDGGPHGLHGVLGPRPEPDADDPLRIAGSAGGALAFGGSAYVSVADRGRLDLRALTVDVVARAAASPGLYRYLVVRGSRGCFAGAYGLYTAANGGFAFYVFDGERYFVSAAARPAEVWDGDWHHLTGTFDGRSVRAFVDGREIGGPLTTAEGTAIEYASMPEGMYFGGYLGACRLPFTGDLDSVRIWSYAAAPATVAAGAGVAPGASATAGSDARIISAQPPKSSCKVHASHRQIRARRRVTVRVRAGSTGKPLRGARLSVRRVNGRKVIAFARTNVKGSAKISLRVSSKVGRLRIGVVGRGSCTPAFITIFGR